MRTVDGQQIEQPATMTEVFADGSPWHAHWSPVWRLDDEASRQLVIYCRDSGCTVTAGDIGPVKDDPRFVCDFCPQTAVMITVRPVEGRSAACEAHSEQLTEAFFDSIG